MEKVRSVCVMRDLLRSLAEMESQLMELHGLSLNEAMVVCCIGGDTMSAGSVSENTGLMPSHTSKVLRSVEEKGLLSRTLGETDRRQMRFCLTEKGKEKLASLKAKEIELPEFIRPLFE